MCAQLLLAPSAPAVDDGDHYSPQTRRGQSRAARGLGSNRAPAPPSRRNRERRQDHGGSTPYQVELSPTPGHRRPPPGEPAALHPRPDSSARRAWGPLSGVDARGRSRTLRALPAGAVEADSTSTGLTALLAVPQPDRIGLTLGHRGLPGRRGIWSSNASAWARRSGWAFRAAFNSYQPAVDMWLVVV